MQKICCARRAPDPVASRKMRIQAKVPAEGQWPGIEAPLHGHADEAEIPLDQVGSANEIALHLLAGLARQEGALTFRFHPLGDDRDIQGVREAQNRAKISADCGLASIVMRCSHVSRPMAVAVARLIGGADELAQLGEIDLSDRVGGAAELLGEQAMHAHAIAPRRVQACPQISSIRIPALSQRSWPQVETHSIAQALIELLPQARWLPRPEKS